MLQTAFLVVVFIAGFVGFRRLFLTSLWSERVAYFVILLLPFLIFSHICPIIGGQCIGNDYTMFSLPNQLELMFSVKNGTVPLFVPGYNYGYTASALVMGGLYHPLTWIASAMPGYWEGNAISWLTFYRLISLALAHLLLFKLLRKMTLPLAWALVVSFVATYNLRMLDWFRYASPLESYTGGLYLCGFIGLYWFNPASRMLPFAIVAATYWIITSGHPQAEYYSLIAVVLVSLAFPFFPTEMTGNLPRGWRALGAFWMKAGLCACLGLLLSSVFTLPFYFEFMRTTAVGGGGDLGYSLYLSATLRGLFDNLAAPLSVDVDWAFGGSALIFFPFLAPLCLFWRRRLPVSLWLLWAFSILTFMFMLGALTPVYYVAWKYIPFIQNSRIPGRLSHMLPFFGLFINAWLFKDSESSNRASYSLFSIALCLLSMLPFYATIEAALGPDTAPYPPTKIIVISHQLELVILSLSILTLLGILIYSLNCKRRWISYAVLVCVILQTALVLRNGTWLLPSVPQSETFEQISSRRKSMRHNVYPYCAAAHTGNVARHLQLAPFEPSLAIVCPNVRWVSNHESANTCLADGISTDEIVLERGVATRDSRSFRPAQNDTRPPSYELSLIFGSYNALEFAVKSSQAGYLMINYPYSGQWRCFIDGIETPVFRANGCENGIEVPAGNVNIKFQYWSLAAVVGMFISCISLCLMIVFFNPWQFVENSISTQNLSGKTRYFSTRVRRTSLAAAVAILISVTMFWAWYSSLYTGKNISSGYAYTYSTPLERNLAYKKRTYSDVDGLDNSRTLVVDGDRSVGSGWRGSWWAVDLATRVSIRKVAIFGNTVPNQAIIVKAGDNLNSLKKVAAVSSSKVLQFNPPLTARYISLEALAGTLALDELEVYGLTPEIRSLQDVMASSAHKPFLLSDTELVLEAEDMCFGTAVRMDSEYGLGIGVLVGGAKSPIIAGYILDVAEEGEYRLDLRYAAATPRPIRVRINGKVYGSALEESTGGWMPENQAWSQAGIYPLIKGYNIITLEADSDWPCIDKLRFLKQPNGK